MRIKHNIYLTTYKNQYGWFLIPRHRYTGYLFKIDMDLHLGSRPELDELMNLVTPEDREMLLDSWEGGCFSIVSRVFLNHLLDRRKDNAESIIFVEGWEPYGLLQQ